MTCFKCKCTVVNKFTTMKKSGAVVQFFHCTDNVAPLVTHETLIIPTYPF